MLACVFVMAINFVGFESEIATTAIEQNANCTDTEDLEICVSFNHHPSRNLPEADFRVLILWEPSAVMPWQYRKEIRERFELVIPMSSWRASNLGYEYFSFHPFATPNSYISPWKERNLKLVMINAAKFSAGPKSNYGLRRSASRLLCDSNYSYKLYGQDWQMSRREEVKKRIAALRNSIRGREKIDFSELTSHLFSKYPEYLGSVDDKIALLGEAEMSLVIENESDWVTEKVFDSICAGAVPIYVGPDLSRDFKELEQCLIRADEKAEDIVKTVKNVSQELLFSKKRAIDDYLKIYDDKGIAFWKPERQWNRVGIIIRNELIKHVNRKPS